MTRYISNPENLKLMMNMLREKSRNIQFEAFHVFKVTNTSRILAIFFIKKQMLLSCEILFLLPQVFVANPNKPRPILEILLRNKDKLVEFLSKFHNDRQEDEQFNDEKAYLIKQIKELRPLEEVQ